MSDYDSGVIVAFDQTGTKLAEHHVGKGVSGLEISCPEVGLGCAVDPTRSNILPELVLKNR